MSDDVQSNDPVEIQDQGNTAGESGLYDLESVDPEIREALQPHLKAIEANATKKFQEAAEFRKTWAPYEELGVQNLAPEQLQGLITFAQMASDPEQFANWWKAAGEEQGLFDRFQPEDDLLDFEQEESFDLNKVQELISQAVAENLNPIQERFAAQEQAQVEQEANEAIAQQLEAIRTEYPDLPEGAEDKIIRFAYSYADEDPDNAIQKGFEDYKSIVGQGEKSLFEKKANQPQTPEGPGVPATAAEPITSFNDERLKAQAIERLRQSQS